MPTSPIAASDKFAAVTPSDTVVLSWNGDQYATKALFVGGAGNIAIKDRANNTVVFTGVAAGSVLPVTTGQVMSTSTTATNIVALY